MKKLVLVSILLIMLTACGNTTSQNTTEHSTQISTTEISETEIKSASTQTTTKTEKTLRKLMRLISPYLKSVRKKAIYLRRILITASQFLMKTEAVIIKNL